MLDYRAEKSPALACTHRSLVSFCIAMTALFAGCSGGTTYERAESAAQSGDYEKAIELFSELASTSDDPAVFGNRGNCYSYMGNLDAALADYKKALDLINARSPSGDDPILPYIYYNRCHAYDRAKKYQLAVADYEKTIETQSDYPDVKNNLAWLLATCADASVRNPTRAVELADQELAGATEDPGMLDTIAACYAVAGDFKRAVSVQERAVSLSPDGAEKQQMHARLELYRNRKPFVDTE